MKKTKLYRKPQLMRHGKLSSITRNISTGSAAETFGSNMKVTGA
ncbi:hypothetical protein HNQ92_000657 [Rhabdobacter roseus]|uniref:Uncharacterized protein n=1 Tax=Rhabdobacter roseus TaxID=1655419 RepID=A0A840TEI4_9BACT|nr:hypothetical protein [Rhabdobacter roseus]MBB5282536.1 hypothetical protein [Rhabdobacter roseus]